MEDLLRRLPNTFIPLFVAIDIFAVLPVFLSLTHDLSAARKRKVARESILTALIVSLIFIGLGEGIFRILGITNDDFKIAGGLVLLVFAVLDLVRRDDRARRSRGRFGVVPVGVPLIVGPAVLTTLLVLVDHFGVLATVLSLLINLGIVSVSFQKGQLLVKRIGEGGVIAVSKVMALLLASIAVMMIRLGLQNLIAP